MVKVIGINEKIASRGLSNASKQHLPIFESSCRNAAKILGLPDYHELQTSRQASKFFRKTGLVYKTIHNLI